MLARRETEVVTKRWAVLGRVLAALSLVCWFGDFLVYYWPNVPTTPYPESGNIYPLQVHGGYLYFTKALIRFHTSLLIVAAASAAGYVLIRLRIPKGNL